MKLVLKNTKLVFVGTPAPTEKEYMKNISASNTNGIAVPNVNFFDGYSYETSFVQEGGVCNNVVGILAYGDNPCRFGIRSITNTGGDSAMTVRYGVTENGDARDTGRITPFVAGSPTKDITVKALKMSAVCNINGEAVTKQYSFENDEPIYGTMTLRFMAFIATGEDGSGVDFAHFRYFKIFDNNNELINHFVPAIDYQGRPCLYDKVNDVCYYADNDSYISCYNS